MTQDIVKTMGGRAVSKLEADGKVVRPKVKQVKDEESKDDVVLRSKEVLRSKDRCLPASRSRHAKRAR